MDTFVAQSNKAIEELKSKHGSNMQELEGILTLIMCKMDTEVDYEILEASFEEAEKILKEMYDCKSLFNVYAFI